jgi:hypothetical protein
MPTDHPTPEELERFLLNRPDPVPPGVPDSSTVPPGTPGRKGEIALHLLAGCAACFRQLRALGWDDERLDRLLIVPSPEPDEDSDEPDQDRRRSPTRGRRARYNYDRAFARAEEALAKLLAGGPLPERADREGIRELAPLVAALDAIPPEERERRVLEDSRLARPRLVHYLIERSQRARRRDPAIMLQHANLARLTAEACSARAAGGTRRLADLRAMAWSEYGAALRTGARWSEASRALAEAEHWRARGTGDPLLRAVLLRHLISLRRDERCRDENLALLKETERVYRSLGRERELAVALHDLSLLYAELGDADRAVSVLSRGGDLASSAHAPGLLRRTFG